MNGGTEVGDVQNPEGQSSDCPRPGSPEVQWWEEGQMGPRGLICSLSSEFFSNNSHAQNNEEGSQWEKRTKLWQTNTGLLNTVSKTKYLL